jgi:hypothetical protein
VTSSAFYAEVPTGSRQASMTEFIVTIAYPAKHVPSWKNAAAICEIFNLWMADRLIC